MTLLINDENRVRTLTLNRPDALNAFNEALYDATAEALNAAAEDPDGHSVQDRTSMRWPPGSAILASPRVRTGSPD